MNTFLKYVKIHLVVSIYLDNLPRTYMLDETYAAIRTKHQNSVCCILKKNNCSSGGSIGILIESNTLFSD
jgi:hypothetical protein